MKVILIVLMTLSAACSAEPDKKLVANNTTANNATANNTTVNNTTVNNTTVNNTTVNNTTVNNTTVPVLDTAMLDLLFVIDNSGSMCEEQQVLAQNAELLFNGLADAGVDFQIGITTTDMNADYPLEPVAKPGTLQSQPQPIPGFDRSCHLAKDGTGATVAGDFAPIHENRRIAAGCMATPDPAFAAELSNADIECALYGNPQGCSIARVGCGGGSACTPEDLFPPASSYRSIPRVLRSSDYASIADLKADFVCAALVGTRGYGIEKGLAAAVLAVDPAMTGGAVDGAAPNASAPNHGLLRKDAKFGVVFVTDENDCSHDGTLNEASPCGGDVCEFANKLDAADSALLGTAALQQQLMANLRGSKEQPELTTRDVFVASLHANSRRFTGAAASGDQCAAPEYPGIAPSCATGLGVGYSGDRYDRFLAEFPDASTFPKRVDDNPVTGWVCTGDFRPALAGLAEGLVEGLDLQK